MVWLSPMSTHNHTWVGLEEIARGEVFGDWKRFTYYVNGLRQYIYCRTQKVFITLFANWCRQASIMNNRKKPDGLPLSDEQWNKIKYSYTLEDVEGVSISIEDVIMDNPDSRPYRCKSLVHSQYGEYIQ